MDMYNKLRRMSISMLLLLAAITIFTSSVHAQGTAGNVFDAVPLESRSRLVERLREYVGYEKERQYEKLYELIYDLNDKKASKEAYAAARRELEERRGIVQSFTPKSILNITIADGDAPTFSIVGIAKVRRKGQTSEGEMTISARLQ